MPPGRSARCAAKTRHGLTEDNCTQGAATRVAAPCDDGGADRNRTGDRGFADRSLSHLGTAPSGIGIIQHSPQWRQALNRLERLL